MRFNLAWAVLALAVASPNLTAATVGNDAPLVSSLTYLDAARAGTRLVVVGDRGNILYSDDEGQGWSKAKTPTNVLLTAVCFADARHGWAVGHDAVVLGTDDGGATWTQQYSDPLGGADKAAADAPADDQYADDASYDDNYDEMPAVDTSGAPFLDVICESADRAIAVGGYGYTVETVDGGTSWQKRTADMPNPDGWHLYAIAQVPETSTLLVAGEKGTLLRSRDNGVSWKKLDSPYAGTFFGLTVTPDLVLAYGMQGKLFASRDAGSSWRQIKTGVTRAINDGVVLGDGTIILAGQSGAVLVSHDNGNSVALQYLKNRETVSALLPLTDDSLLTVGDHGINIVNGIR